MRSRLVAERRPGCTAGCRWVCRWLPAPLALGLIVIGALGFDFGIQATLVSHQTLIYGLDPAARSRLNAVMFTLIFIGMAAGSALGSLLLGAWGWPGVIALATVSALGAFLTEIELDPVKVAVERNGAIVERSGLADVASVTRPCDCSR